MQSIQTYLIVFVGAGIGGALRHGVNRAALSVLGASVPWSTFAINAAGSFAMGLVAGWFAFRAASGPANLQLFLATGILGGFTTFSAYSLDAVMLWERGQIWAAAAYVIGSVVVSILGVLAGLAIMRTTG